MKENLSITKIRRSGYISFALNDETEFNIEQLLSGTLELRNRSHVVGVSHLTGRRRSLSDQEFATLRKVPSSWTRFPSDLTETHDLPALPALIRDGFLIVESDDEAAQALLNKHREIENNFWPQEAFLFHHSILETERRYARKAESYDYKKNLETAHVDAEKFIESYGSPPDPDYRHGRTPGIRLPGELPSDSFFRTLQSRLTTRNFLREEPMTAEQCSVLLRSTFGALARFDVSASFSFYHKASASGGGLHPIEAFPIALNVEGIKPGIYHYVASKHELNLVKEPPIGKLRALAAEICQRQEFVADASLVVVLVARWKRNYWKYRNRANTYNVVMMDAGHLSQTFYLTATRLSLGSFYTAALDHSLILENLGLNPEGFGPLGLCVSGAIDEQAPDLKLTALPTSSPENTG